MQIWRGRFFLYLHQFCKVNRQPWDVWNYFIKKLNRSHPWSNFLIITFNSKSKRSNYLTCKRRQLHCGRRYPKERLYLLLFDFHWVLRWSLTLLIACRATNINGLCTWDCTWRCVATSMIFLLKFIMRGVLWPTVDNLV